MARVALRLGDVVLLTTTDARGRDEFNVYLADLSLTVEERLSSIDQPTKDLVAAVADTCRRVGDVKHIVFMDADNALKTWWIAAIGAFKGLDRRPKVSFFLTRWSSSLAWAGLKDLYYLKIRSAKIVLVLLARLTRTVDRCSGFAGRDVTSPGWPVRNVRDPAICSARSTDRSRLRTELSLPHDRKLVGIFGGINVRKYPPLALDAVLAADDDADLLLAGPFDADARSWLDALEPAHRQRVLVVDRFLSNADLDRMLAASDVVLLLMRLEGPSGIMGKAMVADVPVVTAGSGSRARELETLHRGAATESEVASLAKGLHRVLNSSEGRRPRTMELPTADTFGAAVLGLDGADPVVRRRRWGRRSGQAVQDDESATTGVPR
ncbi:glycosyltransferase [Aeromicrobium sp.]|uniref:glycosyltransferase n=1 Tax=Aeromicrobium sp. TaxID=1871063 RepID=UPI0030C2B6C6